jgi:hypothetical protein
MLSFLTFKNETIKEQEKIQDLDKMIYDVLLSMDSKKNKIDKQKVRKVITEFKSIVNESNIDPSNKK